MLILHARKGVVAPPWTVGKKSRRHCRASTPTITALRRNYHDPVRLSAREELLAELAEEAVTARLHADTARFHHGSARAYARSLQLLVGEELDLYRDKQQARYATQEVDLGPMRWQARRYRSFDSRHV